MITICDIFILQKSYTFVGFESNLVTSGAPELKPHNPNGDWPVKNQNDHDMNIKIIVLVKLIFNMLY